MEGWGKSGVTSRRLPTGRRDLTEHLLIVSLAPAPLPGTPRHYFTQSFQQNYDEGTAALFYTEGRVKTQKG